MRLPDGSTLMHGSAPYDPQKAHEYYIKNRKLKGRKPGQLVTKSQGFESTSAKPTKRKSNSFTVKSANGTVRLSPKELAEQKAYAAVRVQRIASKLHKLESALRVKMAEAKKKERDSKKPDTASEKAAKAKDSEKYRDKHKQELKNKAKKAAASEKKDSKPDLNSVAGLEKAIDSAKNSLMAAVERQRNLASAVKN